MKNKIEVQILTPATREKLIELRDEIRKVDGLGAFDLQLPPAPLTPGKMDGGLTFLILEAVISGMTHFTADKTLEYYQEKIASITKRVLGTESHESQEESAIEAMSGPEPAQDEKWKVAISSSSNGIKSVTAYDANGSTNLYTNREYSIDPEHTYAILIGTSQYDDRANFSPIPPVAGNLDEMYRVLTDKTMVGIPYENVTRLYNESCINIKEELRNISRINDIKTLIVYYSGHGQNMGNNQLSLIAKDTRNIDEELHNDLPYSYVEKMMNSSQADQKIVFIDACHSGLAAQGNNNVFDFEPVVGTFTLASTSADDSSYFKRDSANTYFTSYLTDAFKEGIKNSNTMLSLNDLFDYTSQKLSKARLPAPVCKAQLKNIVADKFYLSGNPSFSLEARLNMPKVLAQQGRYEEARREYILLEKEYPENLALRNEHIEFERNTEFNRLVKEGDLLFFRDKNFRAAQAKYREALNIKNDENIRDKIADCENSLLSQSNQPQPQPIRMEQKLPPVQENKERIVRRDPEPYKKPAPPPPVKKSKIPIKAGIIILAALSLLYYLLKPHGVTLKDKDGNTFIYKGDKKNELPDGQGVAKYKNGNSYDGEWTNGYMDGKGTFTWANGDTYTGYFKNGYLNGIGEMKYDNGNVYNGVWSSGVMQGQVKAKFKNGNSYEGNWYNNNENGYGKFTWANGDTYEGNYKNGTRDGSGTCIVQNSDLYNCPNARKYIGYWRNDLKEGFGRCFDINGNLIYEGNFNNDKPVLAYPNRP
ncbi:MAG: caspase family protein [Chitinophagaceae bacterium]